MPGTAGASKALTENPDTVCAAQGFEASEHPAHMSFDPAFEVKEISGGRSGDASDAIGKELQETAETAGFCKDAGTEDEAVE